MTKLQNIEIKSYDCTDHDPIDEWIPDDPYDVDFWMNFTIGPKNVEAGDNFQVHFITKNAWAHVNDKRSKLVIIEKFSLEDLLEKMNEILGSADDSDWAHAAPQLNKYLYWEFDSYK